MYRGDIFKSQIDQNKENVILHLGETPSQKINIVWESMASRKANKQIVSMAIQ